MNEWKNYFVLNQLKRTAIMIKYQFSASPSSPFPLRQSIYLPDLNLTFPGVSQHEVDNQSGGLLSQARELAESRRPVGLGLSKVSSFGSPITGPTSAPSY